MRAFGWVVIASFVVGGCASGEKVGGETDAPAGADAPAIDGPTDDAPPPDATPPDACIPSPGGEVCNGVDDDCNGATDEGFAGVGEACSAGVGACLVNGQTVCTADGQGVECDATAGTPGAELCGNAIDDDCDTMTDEGFVIGGACAVGVGECRRNGTIVCSGDGLATTCDAVAGPEAPEVCDGLDNDCDGTSDDGFGVGSGCDGADGDLCTEGVITCNASGGTTCSDTTGTTVDMCGGGDEDCDPSSADGSEDPQTGTMCDGADTDLCVEGVRACAGGTLTCTDTTSSTVDLCGGGDQDCDASSGDGSEDPAVGTVCDGADTDLCVEGITGCTGGTLNCTDTTGSTVDLCGGGDQDCDPSSADGAEDPAVGTQCDGPDTDLCLEGVTGCASGGLTCNDTSGSTVDLCGGGDQDCDPSSADGAEDPAVGTACDGTDGDACLEGTQTCAGGALACSDTTGTISEVCNALDDDCDGVADDGIVRDDNPACSSGTFYLGSVSGDTGAGVVTDSWTDEEWDRVTITEDDSDIFTSVYLSAQIRLDPGPGTDFDLYVYCTSCGGALIGSSSNAGSASDIVYFRHDDQPFVFDDRDLIIEVRHWSSTVCAPWTLTVTGNPATSVASTCP